MKCYNHSNLEAVAVCRYCGRAICHDCTAEVGLTCSCKGRCESMVAIMNDLVDSGKSVYRNTSNLQLGYGIFILLLCVVFLAPAIYRIVKGDTSEWIYFLLACGLIFGGMGIASLVSARRFRKQ